MSSSGAVSLVVDRVIRAEVTAIANVAGLAGMATFLQMGVVISRVCVRVLLPVRTISS
jgi:hypothetical protein